MARALLALGLLGCGSEPITGETRRFVVDRIAVPATTLEAERHAGDLDGDGEPENKLGTVTAALGAIGDLSKHADSMIASGALELVVTMQADSFDDDATIGIGIGIGDGEHVRGRVSGGTFASERVHRGGERGAVVRLPVFINADPIALALAAYELDAVPDGMGGYDAIVRGVVEEEAARDAAYAGLDQMIATEPERHLVFHRGLDLDRDGRLSVAEYDNSIVTLLVTSDVKHGACEACVSIAFGVHLAACPDGRCSAALPAEPCRDRVRDGDETDVDCGGSCQPCADGLACSLATDCQSAGCDAGRCRAATCGDGVRDGIESDADCGGPCGVCATGQTCAAATDCASGACSNSSASAGVCMP